MTPYPGPMNGDRAEFERAAANIQMKERPDWPLPSFDARDWAEAFCKIAAQHGYRDRDGKPIDEAWMATWFANTLMRGYDEARARLAAERDEARADFGRSVFDRAKAQRSEAELHGQVDRLQGLLRRCRTVLSNMARQNEGWLSFIKRWPISHEPLRSDARHLVPLIDEALPQEPL